MSDQILEMMRKNGRCKKDGRTYALVHQAYIADNNTYEAYAICLEDDDEEGWRKAYRIIWNVLDEYDPEIMNEDMACDWDKPSEIEYKGMEYSVSQKRLV